MKYSRAFISTFSFYLTLEIVSLWILLIPFETHNLTIFESSHLINSIVTFLLIVLYFRLINRNYLFSLNKTNSKFYLFAILLGIGFVFFQSVLKIIYFQEILPDFFNYEFTLKRLTTHNVLASIILVPITEELFFRKYIQGGLIKNYKPLNSILFASFLFAFIHIPFASLFFDSIDFSLHRAYIALFGGLISGVLYYKSNSIGPSIIFHIFWNLTSYIV